MVYDPVVTSAVQAFVCMLNHLFNCRNCIVNNARMLNNYYKKGANTRLPPYQHEVKPVN